MGSSLFCFVTGWRQALFVLDRKNLVGEDQTINVNFCSAFLHILADFMRTLSELVAAGLVMALDTNSELTDAYCAIVVEVFILGPAVYIVSELVTRMKTRRSRFQLVATHIEPFGEGHGAVCMSSPLAIAEEVR